MEALTTQLARTPLSDVFITDQLQRRAPKRTDFLKEKIALQDLTARMAHAPDEVLPRFVELAMQMTGGVSAGLSLLDMESLRVFKWRHLCGTLEVFEGASTPRNDSPCGVTIEQAAPVLTYHSERGYKWIADTNVSLPEVLLVPLFIDGPEPLGTLWVVSDSAGHFDQGDARVVTELATFVGIALKIKRTEERLRTMLNAQELVTQEMSHRLNNVFALIQGIVNLSAKGASDKQDLARTVSGRLQALAGAHALVLPGLSDKAAPSLDFAALLEAILRPYQDTDGALTRVGLHGPRLDCNKDAISSIALIFHELTTNSAKYGALHLETGKVDVRWRVDGEMLVLQWRESGGPPVLAPARAGFGSRLVQAAVHQVDGTIKYSWEPAGVLVDVSVPIARIGNSDRGLGTYGSASD